MRVIPTVQTISVQTVDLTMTEEEALALVGPINDLFLSSDKYSGAEKDAVDALWSATVAALTDYSF